MIVSALCLLVCAVLLLGVSLLHVGARITCAILYPEATRHRDARRGEWPYNNDGDRP